MSNSYKRREQKLIVVKPKLSPKCKSTMRAKCLDTHATANSKWIIVCDKCNEQCKIEDIISNNTKCTAKET
jgi:hypothetical protein